MKRIIHYPFEGFNFELEVSFHTNMAGVFIEEIKPTNMVEGNYNKQDFYHHLAVLRYSIVKGERDKEVKRILTQVLNCEDKCADKPECFITIALMALSIILAITIFLL